MTYPHIAAARRTVDWFLTSYATIVRLGPEDVSFTGGKLAASAGQVVWQGPVSVASVNEGSRVIGEGREVVEEQTWRMRAPLDAQVALPGDRVEITSPGDLHIPSPYLWVKTVSGRQEAVLARFTLVESRPGAVV